MDRQTDTQARSSWWLITINNPTEADMTLIKTLPPFVKYCRGQQEIGDNGTLHIQALANTTQVRLSQVKSWLMRAHLEPVKTKLHRERSMAYVWKDDTAVENTRFEVGKIEDSPVGFDEIMLKVANVLLDNQDEHPLITDRQIVQWMGTPEQITTKVRAEREFLFATSEILRENFALISMFARPDYLRTWIMYREVILEKVRLDRQTTITVEI